MQITEEIPFIDIELNGYPPVLREFRDRLDIYRPKTVAWGIRLRSEQMLVRHYSCELEEMNLLPDFDW